MFKFRHGNVRPRRRVIAAGTGLALSLTLAACGGSGTATPAAVGGSATTKVSTGQAPTGTPLTIENITDNGASNPEPDMTPAGQAAVAYVNAHGGINGHPLRIIFCSGQMSPTQEEACATQAAGNSSVLATVGDYISADGGAADIMAQHGLPQIGPYAISKGAFTCTTCYLLSPANLDPAALAEMMAREAGSTKLAFVSVNFPGAQTQVAEMNQLLSLSHTSATIVKTIFVPITADTFASVVAELQSAQVNGVMFGLSVTQGPAFLRAVSAAGYSEPLGTILSTVAPSTLPSLGASTSKLYVVGDYNRSGAAYSTFLKAETAAVGSSSSTALGSETAFNEWLSVMTFANVARSVKTVTRAAINTAMGQLTNYATGATPPLNWSPSAKALTFFSGQFARVYSPYVYYYKVKGGTYVPVGSGAPQPLL